MPRRLIPWTRSSPTRGSPSWWEPSAVLFLLGTVVDYEVTRLSSKFVFRNPNQTDACGCGESVTIQPAAAPDA